MPPQRVPYKLDISTAPPDVFVDMGDTDWSRLSWKDVGRPYRVENWARDKREWEAERGAPLPVQEGWKKFNASFHKLFLTDTHEASKRARQEAIAAISRFDIHGAREAVAELVQMKVWNKVHMVEDAVWDPRGKRALFQGLDLERPRILFLGAADGYEAMQLMAMYPGGQAVLVDYDDFCRTDRFGRFPAEYPFLGVDPSTGHPRVWHREEMDIEFEVADIRDLRYGREFDLVVSVGLVEHFPDEHKPEAFEFHRRFLKPGGLAIITTPRDQLRGRAFYSIMADWMNYGYRELMTVRQLGLYATENGLNVRRAGYIKAHNGVICTVA
jgi:SAM-dependent methyltransferase